MKWAYAMIATVWITCTACAWTMDRESQHYGVEYAESR